MGRELIVKVKEKKELSEIPDSLVGRALIICEEDIKSTRAFLRRYFGVFLTNKVVKGKLDDEAILKHHLSSRERNYLELYKRILKGNEKSVIDLGCGVNGFSYGFLNKLVSDVGYVGVEASGQLVSLMNDYFSKNKFNAFAFQRDLFDLDFSISLLKKQEKPRCVFLFQVLDALECFERDFSKKLLVAINENSERIVVSVPLKSLSGGMKKTSGRWVLDFVKDNFNLIDDFELNGERFIVFE